jgi:peptide/nickel transport system substrate-binding protein
LMTLGGTLPAPALRQIRTTHPGLVHVNPAMQTDYLILNVNVPPFDDVRVRRALNFALDRRAVARIWGPRGATPTCQILPPQMPGYRPYCPYTRAPESDGRWRAADLGRARRLIAASGTKGMKVVVWNSPEPGSFMEEMRAAVRLLRRLGYRAQLKIVPTAAYARRSGNSRYRIQASSGAWVADYPSASAFVTLLLSCATFTPNRDYTTNAGGFCDPAIDRRATHAALLQTTRPDQAARLWAGIDRELVDRAVWLPMVTPTTTDVVSSRVGNFQFHLLWGLLVDQLWVR